MNAKAAIHPNQLDIINTMFMPEERLIIWAKRVMAAYKDASEKGLGVFSLDGKMVDKPVMDRAKKILKKVEKFSN